MFAAVLASVVSKNPEDGRGVSVVKGVRSTVDGVFNGRSLPGSNPDGVDNRKSRTWSNQV